MIDVRRELAMRKFEVKSTKVKINEIYGNFGFKKIDPSYDLENLKKDIKTNGILTPILVFRIDTIEGGAGFKYYMLDGNHRCFALKELYGDDHEVEVVYGVQDVADPRHIL